MSFPARAPAFAALGDETRLALVRKLSGGQPHSIALLTRGSRLTRQAITKHLRVLERARIVRRRPSGRESLYSFDPHSVDAKNEYLENISAQWDQTLSRFKSFVEE